MQVGRCTPIQPVIFIGLALGGVGLPGLLSLTWMVALGQASYGLYILHIPLLAYFASSERILKVGTRFGWVPFCTYSAICIGVSYLVFLLYEEPSRAFLLRHLKKAPLPRSFHLAKTYPTEEASG